MPLYSPLVEWKHIRSHYAQLFAEAKRRGETQETIATRGKLSRQNVVSKLLKNRNLGPQVETFIRAVEGLGMMPSDFFLQIERSQKAYLKEPEKQEQDESLGAPQGEVHGRPVSSPDPLALEVLIAGLGENILRAADRVADRLESLTTARPRQTRRSKAGDRRRQKAS